MRRARKRPKKAVWLAILRISRSRYFLDRPFFKADLSQIEFAEAPGLGQAEIGQIAGLDAEERAGPGVHGHGIRPGDDRLAQLGVGGPAALRPVADEDAVGVEDRQPGLEEGGEVDDGLVEALMELVPGPARGPEPVLA